MHNDKNIECNKYSVRNILKIQTIKRHMTEVWQYPYVDIFKSFDIWEWKTARKVGDVTHELVFFNFLEILNKI